MGVNARALWTASDDGACVALLSWPVQGEAIARSQRVSSKHIHTVALGPKSAGLVRAVRRPSRGYGLARDPFTITALDAVSTLEARAGLAVRVANVPVSPRFGLCAARYVRCEVASSVEQVLAGLSLYELALRQSAKQERQRESCV